MCNNYVISYVIVRELSRGRKTIMHTSLSRNVVAITTALMLSMGVVGCGQQAAAPEPDAGAEETTEATAQQSEGTEAEGYTYEGIEQWDAENPALGTTMRTIMSSMGTEGMDFDAFIHSEMGEFAMHSMDIAALGAIDSPEVAEYWNDLGMTHEAHDAADADKQWTSLVPNDYDASKSYPLLFVWHGNDNPILLAEGYGIGQAAAEKDWIVVFPWAQNDDIHLDEFDRIYAFMTENYNIDTTRVYSTGFSKGGATTANLARERADVLAAAAPCGISASANSTLEGALNYGLTDAPTADYQAIPIQLYGGQYDVFGAMPYDDEFKIDGINNYLKGFGIDKKQSLEESTKLLAEGSEVERAIGLSFDEEETRSIDGTSYHFGRYLDADGNVVLQVVQADGAIHWPTPSMGTLVVEFLEGHTK